jgi:hypothetical protein
MNFLTDEEKAYLKALHKKESNGKVRDRIKAVLLYDKGWTFLEIADALLLSEEAVRHHFSEYKSSKKLKPESGGSEEKLSREQADKLSEHLQKHIYDSQSELGQSFRNRVRDKFSPMGKPACV